MYIHIECQCKQHPRQLLLPWSEPHWAARYVTRLLIKPMPTVFFLFLSVFLNSHPMHVRRMTSEMISHPHELASLDVILPLQQK